MNTGNRPAHLGNRDGRVIYARSIAVPQARPDKQMPEADQPALVSLHPFEGTETSPVVLSVAAHASALHKAGSDTVEPKRMSRTTPVYAPTSTAKPVVQAAAKQRRVVAKPASSTHHRVKAARRVVDGFSYGAISHDENVAHEPPETPIEDIIVSPVPKHANSPMESIVMDIDDGDESAKHSKWRWMGLKKVHSLYGLASLLFIFGLYVAIDGWMINQAASEQSEVLAAQTDSTSEQGGGSPQPSEAAPSSTHEYVVAPDMPRKLSIPSIGVSARVLRMGVRSDNQMEAPKNIYDTGWYSGSSKPTDAAGAILIDGHVSGPTKQGVFYNIKKLNTGDEISLERGDGQVSTFVVQRVETKLVSEVDMGVMMQSFDKTKLGLNLITCGGQFNARENKYESRTLVFAVQK